MVISSETTLSMEELPINDMNGQSYGFVVYRHRAHVTNSSKLRIRGHIRDFAQVLVNEQLQTPPITSPKDLEAFGSWCLRYFTLILCLNSSNYVNIVRDASFRFGSWKPLISEDAQSLFDIDIVVENMGRVNFGEPHDFKQKKGLWEGPVFLDGVRLSNWQIIPLEFKSDWVRALRNWKPYQANSSTVPGPLLVRATLSVKEPIADTFIDMSSWGKGVVFVNGFNLGRYWSQMGPQKTLYLPAPLLRIGENTVFNFRKFTKFKLILRVFQIVIYEQYTPSANVKFSDKPVLGEKRHTKSMDM